MDWLDIGSIVVGFLAGWFGAMFYYGELCTLAAVLKAMTVGLWRRG